MIHAEVEGRDLVVTFGTGEKALRYVIEPKSAREGRALSAHYLSSLLSTDVTAEDFGNHLIDAVGQENYDRADGELREEEMNAFLVAAFNWQTAGGLQGAMIALGLAQSESGETGPKAAAARLTSLLAPLLSQISRSSASGNQTPTDGTPGTSTPTGGRKGVKQPSDRRAPQPKASKAAKAKRPQTTDSNSPETNSSDSSQEV